MTNRQADEHTRRAWIREAKATLDRWDDLLDEIDSKIESAQDDVRADIRARLESARRSATDAKERWQGVKNETDETLANVREEVATAWDGNKAAFERSLEEIRSALG